MQAHHDFIRRTPVQAYANRVHRHGESFFEVTAIGFVHATPEQAWQVLTDYEHLHEFVPDLRSVRVLSRNEDGVVVEQTSSAGFLFVAQVIRMRLQIEERPHSTIDVTMLDGDMKRYRTHWELDPLEQDGERGTRVSFSGAMEPGFFVPPLVGRGIVQANLKKTVEAVVAEIERRNMH
ncbi:MAG TPA: SRPBCC family protein [Noviherbaspirillum sp.]|uniref:SRPBCC family protein n=1 Tax=Noviherbaspirillum sp. TaxID=1926288 RepID=UPI002D39984C|nr:SRPBCC family protein [Noviherbaspirillum sp.]HYD94768.1 SRPBCC family protein [Noviherbaspirillum sp.]